MDSRYHGTHYTGDAAQIAQRDNFLSIVVPETMASTAYQNNGVIVLWWDETENRDDPAHTIPEIIISPDNILYTHSSDLLTMQEIFGVGPCLLDACNATDLSDLFKAGSIPQNNLPTPEPSTISAVVPGIGTLASRRYASRSKSR